MMPASLRRRIGPAPVGEGLAQPVQRHGQRHDGEPRLQPRAEVEAAQRLQHVEAKPARADHRGDDDHVQGQHDDLVDADHQRFLGRWHHHPPGHLTPGAADHPAEVADLGRDAGQRQHGDPRHRRHGVDQGGDHRRGRAEAEQDQDRHEVGEDRNRLHEVEDRHDGPSEPGPAMRRDAKKKPARDAQRNRDEDGGKRDHGAGPLAEHGDEQEAPGHQRRKPWPARAVADDRHQGGDADPADRRHRHAQHGGAVRQQPQRDGVGHLDDCCEKAGELAEGEQAEAGVVHQPLQGVGDPEAHRGHPGVRKLEGPGKGGVPPGRQDGDTGQDRKPGPGTKGCGLDRAGAGWGKVGHFAQPCSIRSMTVVRGRWPTSVPSSSVTPTTSVPSP